MRSSLIAVTAALLACGDARIQSDDSADTDSTDGGMRPGLGEMYSECEQVYECTPLDVCVFPPEELGFCTRECSDVDDCDDSPGGTADVVCVDVSETDPTEVCALDCAGSRTCPAGMRCESVMSNEGARSLCF